MMMPIAASRVAPDEIGCEEPSGDVLHITPTSHQARDRNKPQHRGEREREMGFFWPPLEQKKKKKKKKKKNTNKKNKKHHNTKNPKHTHNEQNTKNTQHTQEKAAMSPQ